MENNAWIDGLFSHSYAEAREKFLSAAARRGLPVESHELELVGADGETLATDVVLDGPADASRMLLVISGVHGVEGFCGSAVQTGMLLAAHQGADALRDTAVLHVHAINPFGFSHLRRVTQENVDLNRNFVDFAKPLPVNPGYAEIHELLLPAAWPPEAEVEAALAAYRDRHGARGLQRAMSLGQHGFADGMFFGGHRPTWSNDTFRRILKRHAPKVRQLASIDIHTGLGAYGVGERIFASFDDDPAVLVRAERWWGELTSVTTGTSTSIPLTGPIQTAITEECRGAQHVGICLEYGTWPSERVTGALRAEHWLHRHGDTDAARSAAIKRALKDAFYPDAADWKRAVWQQASQACLSALEGLQEDASQAMLA
ncbi:M14 family metallopeptidase [Variovorax sp. J31P179]|uniref:M14 family metallopeptidase n=1 Tax=Variovorax sp. J31P179 TaxID=3053508 RepID=UPI00257692A4|nr:M14 family metallopeptidase [Variovorax sp. J31P179]MDM0085181.1 M14 family metallopeptidase [Variovorax sp. J31P179]